MLTKYIIVDGSETLLETYKPADVVQFLAAEYKGE